MCFSLAQAEPAPTSNPPSYYADLYKKHHLEGGHVIKLGPNNDDAAKAALKTWPGALRIVRFRRGREGFP